MDFNFYWLLGNFSKVALFSFSFALILIFFVLKFFPRLGLMDRPHRYGLKRDPIPYYGGLAIYFTFLAGVLLFVDFNYQVLGLLAGATLICLVGFFDDYFGLSPFFRLFCQFLAAVFLILAGVGVEFLNLPFIGGINFSDIDFQFSWGGILWSFGFASAVFTIIWMMTVINVMNFLDGVPGLNSGVSFIAALTFFILSINPNVNDNLALQLPFAQIALIVASASFAFAIFDFPTPKLLMGDTGSTLLGFLLASLAIFSGGKLATAFLVLGIPILDMIWVVLRRMSEGKKFWIGDKKHLHHRLLDLGFSERRVVLIYLSVTFILGFLAVTLVNTLQKFYLAISICLMMILLAVALNYIPKAKKTNNSN